MVPFNPESEHNANFAEHIEYGCGSRPTSVPLCSILVLMARAVFSCYSTPLFVPCSISEWQLAKKKRDVP
jgi:hypothetical protein